MGTTLTGLTPSTTYDALIKVGDNGPIDGTLKTLSDGLGNDLPMEVSTTGVNFTNQLQQGGVAVPTASQVAAKQDTLVSGTNIKTINGTSVLGSGNIITPTTNPSGVSGAIQFSNGSAFASDASNLFWDNTNKRLGVGTNAPTRNLQVNGIGAFINSDGNTALFLQNSNTGVSSVLHANVGSQNLYFGGFGLLTSGDATFGQLTSLSARVGVKGSGSTSATTSLLVQNSAGTAALTVRDDLSATFGGNITTNNNVIARGLSIGTSGINFQSASNTLIVPSTLGWDVLYNGATNNVQIGRTGFIGSRESSASLQVDSTTQGFLPPRGTNTQMNAIASPATGLVFYDTTNNKLCVYNATSWIPLH
jgi:hypothetical protein